ncbi:MAG TPA: DNA recombination protein RmuC [Allosphingosinicella sp.]|jgi:DNA recombination protein RmuC|nr:DNA recombination protein RmuC [Allosphingosinicella sp.]
MDSSLILFVILALAAGAVAGWSLGARQAALYRKERDDRTEDFRKAITDLAGLQEKLDEARQACADARAQCAGLAAAREAQERSFQERLAEIRDAREALSAQFSEIGGKLLGEAQKNFLERADARFNQAGEKHEEKLKALLQPVETTLKRYEENLAVVEKERQGTYGELKEAVAQLALGNETVRRETQRLANVMRSSPKARGRWGEEQLRTILEAAGLAENVDFALQASVSDGERQLRPDCVIKLPGDRCIVVDVKCPLVAFEQAYDEEDEVRRLDLLLQHAAAMRTYAAELGRKGYWRQFDLSPDFVIMFIPGEHFLSAAAERAPDLIETAFRNGVIIASTINMLALAKIMAGMWRQETLAAQAKEVAEAGKELYKRLTVMGGHVAKLGRNLGLATGAYNDFVGSLESQVLTQAKRFETLKVETGGRTIEPVPMIDTSPRQLAKLDPTELPEAAE